MTIKTPMKLDYTFLMCVNKLTAFVGDAVTSVLGQTDSDFEFIIVANNCNEDLWRFLNTFDDPRIRLYRTKIGQLSFNLNYGLNLARQGYILRIDADDIALPTRLEDTKTKLSDHGYPDLLAGAAFLIDESGHKIGYVSSPCEDAEVKASLWRTNKIIHPACAFRVESVIKLGGYCSGFMSEDYDLWLRASRSKGFTFRNVDVPFIQYRISPGQVRGKSLGYAEVAGHLLREALVLNSLKMLLGSMLACLKRYVKGK
jgi:O86/O127-antigen biosynthesis beta-1,3-galactosyltransferase